MLLCGEKQTFPRAQSQKYSVLLQENQLSDREIKAKFV